jgi:alkylated DNA repair dioxygenase AlkB
MRAENLLFPELMAEPEPPGFRYGENFVTQEEEIALAASVGQLDLRPFEFHGYLGNRRVASFGLQYDYSRRSVEPAGAMPAFLNDLLLRVAEFAGSDAGAFQQVGVNEYRPGAAIGWHKDKPQFGIVVGVSLLGPAMMRFRRAEGSLWERISHELMPRSVYILSGAARAEWEHSIPPVSDLRYSITFRTLAESFGIGKGRDSQAG